MSPRQKQPWFRFYTEAVYDRKLQRLTPAQRWVWVTVLALAKESPRPGYLLIESAVADARDIASTADVRVRDAESALAAFVERGMLSRVDGVWHVTNWDKRQFKSDDVTERTSRHRSRERDRNVPTTLQGTSGPPSSPPLPPTPPNPTPPTPVSPTAPAKSPRKAAAKPLPADWQPTAAHRELAAELGVDCDRAADEMRDWALSKDERKADWNAAFRNWLRRNQPTAKVRPIRQSKPSGGQVAEEYFQLADRLKAEGR